jgi:hypothetical protein
MTTSKKRLRLGMGPKGSEVTSDVETQRRHKQLGRLLKPKYFFLKARIYAPG